MMKNKLCGIDAQGRIVCLPCKNGLNPRYKASRERWLAVHRKGKNARVEKH